MLTQERLKELLHYNLMTGEFTWKVKRGCRQVGDLAGYLQPNGYMSIQLDRIQQGTHRWAVLYVLGYMPEEVDHLDHNRSNNIWSNLRPATRQVNSENASLHSNNTSGQSGVFWSNYHNKWQVRMKNKFKKMFTNKQDAINYRKELEKQYGYHNNHGKRPDKLGQQQ